MTRAEYFIMRGRGHWAKCRVPFRCDFKSPNGTRCLYTVDKGDTYLATDIRDIPTTRITMYGQVVLRCRRYCPSCAAQVMETAEAPMRCPA